ncbi:glycosyltransferase family 2 protein [Mucilaginibacter psychrotolerans]|uniref:Glycosyltransferase family 2 protein n=1 Tax=Mucilaginibacter psychrotolerans TaxID=1524096 RepID=A0A4Y8SPW0_9SPHI|nr:glycosyltransferase family 2 protein [Mucilaginibacter psychrotolerans]TFF40862.1 glycosyltransferase family 2 protein [Mucilaginibacter psychrotolerans]
MKPLVSIIIPVYNAGKYLKQTIISAIDQLWPNTEILIVDDGSTDNSVEIAEQFIGPNIFVFTQENKGASAARNLGFSKSAGKYIQFLDADDILSRDKIAQQAEALEQNPDAVAVCSTVHFKDGSDHKLYNPSANDDAFIYTTTNVIGFIINLWGGNDLKGSMVQPNAWLTPRNIIERAGLWNEELTLNDDGEFFARMVLNAKGIVKTDGINYYRKFPSSKQNLSSQKTQEHLRSALKAIQLKRKYLFSHTESEPAKKAIYRMFTELSVMCYQTEPTVYVQVRRELSSLPNYGYKVVLGGRLINAIAGIFGWHFAKRLQKWHAKISKQLSAKTIHAT